MLFFTKPFSDHAKLSISDFKLCSELVGDLILLSHALGQLLAWLVLSVLLRQEKNAIEVDVEICQFLAVRRSLGEADEDETVHAWWLAIIVLLQDEPVNGDIFNDLLLFGFGQAKLLKV